MFRSFLQTDPPTDKAKDRVAHTRCKRRDVSNKLSLSTAVRRSMSICEKRKKLFLSRETFLGDRYCVNGMIDLRNLSNNYFDKLLILKRVGMFTVHVQYSPMLVLSTFQLDSKTNKDFISPDRATMRPDYVSAGIEFGAKHVTTMKRQSDGWSDRPSCGDAFHSYRHPNGPIRI